MSKMQPANVNYAQLKLPKRRVKGENGESIKVRGFIPDPFRMVVLRERAKLDDFRIDKVPVLSAYSSTDNPHRKVIDVETGDEWDTLSDCARAIKSHGKHIRKAIFEGRRIKGRLIQLAGGESLDSPLEPQKGYKNPYARQDRAKTYQETA